MNTLHKIALSAIAAASLAISVQAQTLFPSQMAEIYANNPTLKATRARVEATSEDNLSGLNLANPEVGFSYMWGQPSDVPNKINVEVTQTFDLPTLTGARRKTAEADNLVALNSITAAQQQISLEAEQALIQYAYSNELCRQLETQVASLETLDKSAAKALEGGQINILDRNKILLELTALRNELQLARIDRDTYLNTLTTLNGGRELTSLPDVWVDAPLPDSFDAWVAEASASSAEIQLLQSSLIRAKAEIDLRKKENLPEFSLGYVNELVKDNNYHGFSVGLSLPLWANHGKVKASRAAETAARLELSAAQDQFRSRKLSQYNRALALRNMSAQYAEFVKTSQATADEYLDKALKQGAISIFEYTTEKEDSYSHTIKFLEARRDYLLARAELFAETLL